MNFNDQSLCQFDNNNPTTLGWPANTGFVAYSYKGVPFPQGVYRGTAPLWDDLLDHIVPLIPGGLHAGWNWGAENRDNVNSPGTVSFHACGRALDLNAPANPNGAGWQTGQYAMPRAAAAIARARGFECGGEWSDGDSMHLELHLTAKGVAVRLAELNAAPAPKPTPKPAPVVTPAKASDYPLPAGYYFGPLSGPTQSISGMAPSGSDAKYRPSIKRIQTVLHVTADGLYGPTTIAHVTGWQAAHGLAHDGLVGPNTWKAMGL